MRVSKQQGRDQFHFYTQQIEFKYQKDTRKKKKKKKKRCFHIK